MLPCVSAEGIPRTRGAGGFLAEGPAFVPPFTRNSHRLQAGVWFGVTNQPRSATPLGLPTDPHPGKQEFHRKRSMHVAFSRPFAREPILETYRSCKRVVHTPLARPPPTNPPPASVRSPVREPMRRKGSACGGAAQSWHSSAASGWPKPPAWTLKARHNIMEHERRLKFEGVNKSGTRARAFFLGGSSDRYLRGLGLADVREILVVIISSTRSCSFYFPSSVRVSHCDRSTVGNRWLVPFANPRGLPRVH